MKTRSRLLNSGRLALLVFFSLVLGMVLVIWITSAVTRDNCCPLVRKPDAGDNPKRFFGPRMAETNRT